MGDRGQVKIISFLKKGNPVFLYTHCKGSQLEDIVRTAMCKRLRWDDPSYLARIIFDEMMTGDEDDNEIGYGIDGYKHPDIEHPLIIIDCRKQMVLFEAEDSRNIIRKVSFENFIEEPLSSEKETQDDYKETQDDYKEAHITCASCNEVIDGSCDYCASNYGCDVFCGVNGLHICRRCYDNMEECD